MGNKQIKLEINIEELKQSVKILTTRLAVVEKVLRDIPNYDDYLKRKQEWHEKDPLLDVAEKVVKEYDMASASLIQRRLSTGYARAVRILDQLEEKGIVNKPDGANPRKVLIKKET